MQPHHLALPLRTTFYFHGHVPLTPSLAPNPTPPTSFIGLPSIIVCCLNRLKCAVVTASFCRSSRCPQRAQKISSTLGLLAQQLPQQSPMRVMMLREGRFSCVLSRMCRMVGMAISWKTGTARKMSASSMNSAKYLRGT